MLSPVNRIVVAFFDHLRRIVTDLATETSPVVILEEACVATILGVTAVETFFNAFARLVVEEPDLPGRERCRKRILKDLAPGRNLSLRKKLAEWPVLLFGQGLDESSLEWKTFERVKERRNAIVHFKVSWESELMFGPPDWAVVDGLADTTVYDSLRPEHAEEALLAAEGMVHLILRTASRAIVIRYMGSPMFWTEG